MAEERTWSSFCKNQVVNMTAALLAKKLAYMLTSNMITGIGPHFCQH